MKKKQIIEEVETPVEDFVAVDLGKCQPVTPLTISFPNEDMNKMVEKINEIIKQL